VGLKTLLLAAVLWLAWPAAAQESYPSKPIRLYVGFPASGGPDLIARLVGAKLAESWGQPVVVENRPGASGSIAADLAAKAAPDGYTLLLSSSGPMTLNTLIMPALRYDALRDFAPVATFGLFPLLLAVHPDLPVRTPGELVAHAKANPGKLNNGASAVSMQLAMEMLKQIAGLDITTVRYAGSAATVTALLRGDVQMTILEATPLLPQVKAGKLRALASVSDRRIAALPELPTMGQSGIGGYEVTFWTGLFAPAGTPQPIVSKLGDALTGMIQLPEVRERMQALGAEPVAEPAARLAARMRADIEKYAPVVKATGLKAE
jgi:tripartite-type tricarboxylate transporter receptor subunit TctC